MRYLVILFILAILFMLGSALFHLIHGGSSERMVRALTWRIGLSIALFLLLMVGFYAGFIPRTGL